MRLRRQNLVDVARTFVSSAGQDVPPDLLIDIPPTIQPVAELCRPLAQDVNVSLVEGSQGGASGRLVLAGAGAISEALITLQAGIWRVSLNLCLSVTGAAPASLNSAQLLIVKPNGAVAGGVVLTVQAVGGSEAGSFDALFHFPVNGHAIRWDISDPTTALSANHSFVAYYACRLL